MKGILPLSSPFPSLSRRLEVEEYIGVVEARMDRRWKRAYGYGCREDLIRLTKVPYRAFADFVLGSLILHFFCVNFVN